MDLLCFWFSFNRPLAKPISWFSEDDRPNRSYT